MKICNRVIKKTLWYIGFFFCCWTAQANTNIETATAKYFKTIQNDPVKVLIFLQNMPKGGDLHYHGGGGSSAAENLIGYGLGQNFCIDPQTFMVSYDPHCKNENRLDTISTNEKLYHHIINAWSMRNFQSLEESAHDHFFAAFAKIEGLAQFKYPEILAETMNRAGVQNTSYVELMIIPDHNASGILGRKIGWKHDFAKQREALLAGGLSDIVANMQKEMTTLEKKTQDILACGTPKAKPGCTVKIYYQYVALREQPPESVFAQLLAGFMFANQDHRFVGINLAQPEDGYISMRDYPTQMQMIAFLHQIYPSVHISLHAGELNTNIVSSEGLLFHMHDAIETAHAERIGHGVTISMEKNADQLLKDMAAKKIMVEINLSSNQAILGITGENHPLPIYLSYHVPIALSTDDEGILRTTLTLEYQKAVLNYHLDYSTLKQLVRNSIYYSFIPGKNLWANDRYQAMTSSCANDTLEKQSISEHCQQFLSANEKAMVQWDLEKRFREFEISVIPA